MSINVGEIGIIIRRTIKDTSDNTVDISSATTKEFRVRIPDRSSVIWTASFVTDGTDGQIQYTNVSGDFDLAGTYRGEGHVILPGPIEYISTDFELEVEEAVGDASVGIVSRTSVKLYMDITSTTDDDLLDTFIDGVSKMFHSQIGYDLFKQTIIETIDIEENFIDTILVDKYPNVSVVAMTNVNVAIDLSTVTVNANTGRIKKNNGTYFTKGIAGLTVMYTTGYDSYPEDLQLAARESIAFLFNNRDSLGLRSEKIGDYSYTLSPSAVQEGLTPFAKNVLDLYKRIQ